MPLKNKKEPYTPPEGSIVLTQPAIFYAPRNQYEAVANDPDGNKHNGFGQSPDEAYKALKESLHEAGHKGEIFAARRAGNVGKAQGEGAVAYNTLNKTVHKVNKAEAADLAGEPPKVK